MFIDGTIEACLLEAIFEFFETLVAFKWRLVLDVGKAPVRNKEACELDCNF